MRISNAFHRTAWILVLSALFLLAGSCTAQSRSIDRPQSRVDILRVSIRLDQFATPSHPSFRVELQNTGENDLLLNLGRMASTGTKEYATAISLVLVSPDGTSLRLEPIRARDDEGADEKPMLLPLPSGATFSIPVDLENYRVAGNGSGPYELKPGTYSVQAQFNGTRAVSDIPFAGAGRQPDATFLSVFRRPVRPFVSSASNRLQFQISGRS